MPLSIDEATRRYEGYVQNIQDSMKMRRRSERIRIQPYTLNNEQRATSTETIDLPFIEEE